MSELYQKIAAWALVGETGLSSKHMAAAALGLKGSGYAPADPADLNRCIMLVDAVPELREHFPAIAASSPQWAKAIQHWDELVALFHAECGPNWSRSQKAQATYRRMKEIGL